MDRNTTMRQMIERFDEAVKNIDSLKFIIGAVKRDPDLEKMEWTAENDTIVIGETYYIQSVGIYRISGAGKGKFSYTIKSPGDLKTLYEGKFDDTAESEPLILTAGDICYVHASADSGEKLVMTLHQTDSLFKMMGSNMVELQTLVEALNVRVGNILQYIDDEVDEKTEDAIGKLTDALKKFNTDSQGELDDFDEKSSKALKEFQDALEDFQKKVDETFDKTYITKEEFSTHATNEKIHLAESEKDIVSKLGASEDGSLTFNGTPIKPKADYVFNTLAEAQVAVDAGEIEDGATVFVHDNEFDKTDDTHSELLLTQDDISAQILLNQAVIQAKQVEQDEVLAQLLLNTTVNVN